MAAIEIPVVTISGNWSGSLASITKRILPSGKVRWLTQVRRRGQRPLSQVFGKKADAQEWANRTEAAISERRHFPEREGGRKTLGELIDRYAEHVLPDKPKVASQYRRHLFWWKEQLGAFFIANVTPSMVEDCKLRLLREEGGTGKPRGNATVNRYLTTLSAVYTFGMSPAVGWVDRHVVRRVEKREEPPWRVRYLSRPVDEKDSEFERLLAACKKSRNQDLYDLVVLAIFTGCRQGELVHLRTAYVNLQESGISLPAEITKTGEPRFVALGGPALEIIERRMAKACAETGYLFPPAPRRNGRPLPAFPRRAWDTALIRARVPNFRFHDLRHTCASYLLMAGATESELKEALGHKTTAMVSRYAHVANKHMQQLAARLAQAVASWNL